MEGPEGQPNGVSAPPSGQTTNEGEEKSNIVTEVPDSGATDTAAPGTGSTEAQLPNLLSKTEIFEEDEEDLPTPGPPVPQSQKAEEKEEELPMPGPPVPQSQKADEEEDELPMPGPPVPQSQRTVKAEVEEEEDFDLIMKNVTPFHHDVEQFEVSKNKKKVEQKKTDNSMKKEESLKDNDKMDTKPQSNDISKQQNESLNEESSVSKKEKTADSADHSEAKENKMEEQKGDNSAPVTGKDNSVPNHVPVVISDATKISVQVPPAGVETPEPGEIHDVKSSKSPTKNMRVHYNSLEPSYYHYNRGMDDDDLGIYDDICDDDGLSDPDDPLHMMASQEFGGLRGSKVRRSKKASVTTQEEEDIPVNHVTWPSDLDHADYRHYSGLRGKACTPASRSESRNASRLHSESRDAMFRRAMTLLSARCTSTGPNGNLGTKKVEAQFGVNSKGRVVAQQYPQYFFIDQKKPIPMPPLKAWNGFNGNVYFEPLRIHAVNDAEQNEAVVQVNDQQNRLLASRKRTSSDRLKRPDSSTTQSSKYTARSTKSSRPVVLLDHKTVLNSFNDLKDDLALLEGQEKTGSLSVRPKSDVTMDRTRRKEMMYNKERICKGSVVHKLSPNDIKRRPKIPLKVNGGRFVPHDQMSPLLRTQTQYSLSNQRLTTNSPDPYHTALPPLEQLRATVRHMDTAETANKAGYRQEIWHETADERESLEDIGDTDKTKKGNDVICVTIKNVKLESKE